MPRHGLIPWVLCVVIFLSASFADDNGTGTGRTSDSPPTPVSSPTSTISPTVGTENATKASGNATQEVKESGFTSYMKKLIQEKATLKRTFFVLLALTGIVVVYFVVKNFLLRRKKTKNRKYGIVKTAGSELEMQPLDQPEDEDDLTLFEARALKLK